jgi:glycosyl transferase, family 25
MIREMKDLTDTKLYYINLDRRPDRKEQFLKQDALAAMPPVERITAIHGQSIDIKNDKRISLNTRVQVKTEYRRSHYEIHSRGALGASLSHYKAWQTFLKTNAKYALIMEDDVELPTAFALMVADCAKDLPADWSIWILGWNHNPVDNTTKDSSPFKQVIHFVGAHCYIITRPAAKQLIDEMFPIQTHIEHYMSNVAFIKGLKIIRDVRFHMPQADRILNISDVRKPDGCPACHVDDNDQANEARRANMQ